MLVNVKFIVRLWSYCEIGTIVTIPRQHGMNWYNLVNYGTTWYCHECMLDVDTLATARKYAVWTMIGTLRINDDTWYTMNGNVNENTRI